MARIAFIALALFAVVAAVAAGGAPPPKGGSGHPHRVREWLHAKHTQLSKWGTAEKTKLQAQWKTQVVPHIVELKKKFGAKWQQEAPKVVALLKQKAGAAFDKAVNYVNQKISG